MWGNDSENGMERIHEKLKAARREKMISTVIMILLGVVLLAWTEQTVAIIGRVIAAVLLIAGVFMIGIFLSRKVQAVLSWGLLVFGAILAMIGILFYANPGMPLSILPSIVGAVVLFNGLTDFGEALRLLRLKYARWWETLCLALLLMGMGAFLLFGANYVVDFILQIVGVVLIIMGVAHLVMAAGLKEAYRDGEPRVSVVDADAVEVKDGVKHENRTENAERETPVVYADAETVTDEEAPYVPVNGTTIVAEEGDYREIK